MFFLALILFMGLTENSSAQSDGWAAGEIVLEYDSGTCDTGVPTDSVYYNVILKFYRDDIGATAGDLPATFPVFVFSPDNNIPITDASPIFLDQIPNSPRSVTQYCLNGNPVATEGAWYKTADPFPIALGDLGAWFFAFAGSTGNGEFRSIEDRNIALGQRFYNETRFNFNCGFVDGTIYKPATQTYKDTTYFNPAPRFSPTDYVFEDPVASFCVGETYEWNLKALAGDGFDNLEFDFAPIWTFKNSLANYLVNQGYSIKSPFPVSGIIDDSDLENRGILRFTADRPFAGPVPFYVRNFRDIWGVLDGDANREIVRRSELVVLSQREFRFIFDRNCNSRLPDFIGGEWREANPGLGDSTFFDTFNASEQAYEFDCAATEFVFNLTEPVLSESLGLIGTDYENQDQGFRLVSWNGNTPPTIDSNAFLDDIPIRSVDTVRIINIDETDMLRMTLDRSVGPGKYTLFMKKGDDLNTLVNRCESTVPEFDSLATIYINTQFEYNHPYDEYTYCFPAGVPPTAVINANTGENEPPYFTGWKYYGGQRFFPPGSAGNPIFDDTTFHDTTLLGPLSFQVDRPNDSNWYNSKINIGAGWWRVGLGYDYSTYDPQTGQVIESRICYDEAEFYVDTITVDSVFIPDFDLCPDEDLPVIDLSSYSSDIIQNSFQWGKWDGETYKKFFSQLTDPSFPPPNDKPDSLGKDYVDVSTKSFIFDTRGAFTGVGDTNHFRALFSMKGKFLPNRTCPVQAEFKVLKQLVKGEIFPRDSAICENNEYQLVNKDSSEYFKPEQYTFQWFFNEDTLQNDTATTSFVQDEGFHKLVVTKTTDNSVCYLRDSIYIEIAPFIDSLSPECSEITFSNGQIEQTFSWPTVPAATSYEVREVYSDNIPGLDNSVGPWEPANGSNGVEHSTRGAQVALQVRGVNDKIADASLCKYGDTSFAAPCKAIVKPTNVFTPNGDGINDFLKFDLVEVYPGSALLIFNRWGNKIYEDDDYFNDWDGEDYKQGTYFYVLDVNDPEEVQGIIKGTFTIIRD